MSATAAHPVDPASYIEFLNRSFPGQWDRAAYDWYIGRSFNGRASELLVRTQGEKVLSGMAVCYRQIRVGECAPIDVAVIGAGATLPDERGRGHYRAVLRDALELSRRQVCAAVLAFVTRESASGRGLLRLGAHAIPSFYIIGHHARPCRVPTPVVPRRSGGFAEILKLFSRQERARGARQLRGAPLARFHYEREEDWRGQFIDRPHGVHAMRTARNSLALIESVRSTDRLQWLGGPDAEFDDSVAVLEAESRRAAQDFFMYTLDARQAEAARGLGCEVRDGYFMLQPTGCSKRAWKLLKSASWSIQSGDRL